MCSLIVAAPQQQQCVQYLAAKQLNIHRYGAEHHTLVTDNLLRKLSS